MKRPQHDLSQDDVEQAHTYCAHPEISAVYFMLTNGREFRLYATGQLTNPILLWTYGETEARLMTLVNIVGPAAIRKHAATMRPDIDVPLGPGLPSKMRIVGGEVIYGDLRSDHPLFQSVRIKGFTSPVNGLGVERATDGRIHAIVGLQSPIPYMAEINRSLGLEAYEFFAADEYISEDIDNPTIFQNAVNARLEPGTPVPIMLGAPPTPLPVEFQMYVVTEAIGFIDGCEFRGSLSFDYNYTLIRGQGSTGNAQFDYLIETSPPVARLEGDGTFRLIVERST